jgi:subtilisin family serine protease
MIVSSISRRNLNLFVGVSVVVSLAFLCIPFTKNAPAQTQTASITITDQYIVVLHDDADARAHAEAAVQAHHFQLLHVYEHAFKGFAFHGSAAAVEALSHNPAVDFIAPDQVVHLIEPVVAQEVLVESQTLPTGIDRIDADLNPISHIDGIDERVNVNVAIIDTGIDPTHPDLNVVGGTNTIGGSSFVDDNGHGSHVAGTVAAIDNAIGVVGVAPGANLYAVKVLNAGGSGSFSSVAAGLDWVARSRTDRDPSNDIAVANMSLAGVGSDDGACGRQNHDVMHKAICGCVAQGVVCVVAAGNSSSDAAGFAPAAYDEVLTVSAIADFDGKPGRTRGKKVIGPDLFASFSDFGADVDIAGPGVSILSTYKDGGYATLSGTSMATPHVTGAVALYVFLHGLANDAAGVAGIRQAITTPGGGYCVAQSDPRGFAGDPDSFPEPLVFVGTP